MSNQTDTPTEQQLEEWRQARLRRRTWFGYLADDTVEHIAQRMLNLLGSGPITVVTNDVDYPFAMPEVRTSQVVKPLEGGPCKGELFGVRRIGDEERDYQMASISWHDDNYVMGMHASHRTEHDAAADSRDESKVKRTTYVLIEGGVTSDPRDRGRRDRVEITFWSASGHKHQWVLMPEQSRD